MSKVALIIGVSTYASGFSPLPSTIRDGEAMRDVLQSPEIGKFDDVTFISDPDPLQMQEAIERTFSGRKKDDLALLFFSGHGAKDSNGKLYLATAITKKTDRGDLVKSTAVSASFIHDILKDSRSKRKVVILDCCFSGAFAHGLSAKDDGTVDLKSQLGGEGCAVLTSSSSVQYSFEQQGEELSVYTRYLVEGMQTGAADLGSDGYISVDELHEYAQSKVHEESPSMNPKIYALEEGYKIQLLEAVAPDPLLKYQRAVEQCAVAGEISQVWRITLDEMRTKLQLSADEADLVETRVLRPYREYQKKLQRYESAFKTAIQQGFPVKESVRAALKQLQRTLALRNKDILAIEEKWEKWAESKLSKPTAIPKTQKVQQPIASSPPAAGTPLPKSVQSVPEHHIESQQASDMSSTNTSSNNTSSAKNINKLWIRTGIVATFALATGAGIFAWVSKQSPVLPSERSISEILRDPELIVPEECERLKDAYEAGDDRVVNTLESSSPVGQKCSGLGFSIAANTDKPSLSELIASPELLSTQDCQRLKDAYDQGETLIVNSLGENPNNTQVGQKCSTLGLAFTFTEPDERSISEILRDPELIVSEECERLKDAYDQRETLIVNSLGENPNNTQVGQKCSNLGEPIALVVKSNPPNRPQNNDPKFCVRNDAGMQVLFDSAGGSQSTGIRVAPGEPVSIISEPVESVFGFDIVEYVQIQKGNGDSGWILMDHIDLEQPCA